MRDNTQKTFDSGENDATDLLVVGMLLYCVLYRALWRSSGVIYCL